MRRATLEDAPAIIALIKDYFARSEVPVQYRDNGQWYVAERDGAIVAVQNWLDESPSQRWLQDTYCFDTRAGRAGLLVLGTFAHDTADREGVTLMGFSELGNDKVGIVLESRGWLPIGILRRRLPKPVETERTA